MSLRPEVVVAGAGVVGLAAALGFAAAGRRVSLLAPGGVPAPVVPDPERWDLRVYALSPANSEWLVGLGAWAPPPRAWPYRGMQVWADDAADALHFDAGDALRPELGHIVEQQALLDALWARLADAGVELRHAALEDVTDVEGEGLRLFTDDGDVLTPSLLVAADGAGSQLRHQAGIDIEQRDYGQLGIVGHARCEADLQSVAWQRFLRSGPLALLPMGPHHAAFVWSAERAEADRLLALDDADFAAELGLAMQGRFGGFTMMAPRAAFPLRLQQAERYAAGRMALVGDAARVVHPLAGQGLNLGLADVRALIAAQAGTALGRPRALATYSRRRRAASADMIAVTDGLHHVFTGAESLAELRNLGLHLTSRIAPLRRLLVERAMGLDTADR